MSDPFDYKRIEHESHCEFWRLSGLAHKGHVPDPDEEQDCNCIRKVVRDAIENLTRETLRRFPRSVALTQIKPDSFDAMGWGKYGNFHSPLCHCFSCQGCQRQQMCDCGGDHVPDEPGGCDCAPDCGACARDDAEVMVAKMHKALEWAAIHLKGNSEQSLKDGCVHCATLEKACPVHEALDASAALTTR